MATLEENINKVISDFDSIEEAIVEKGVEVPYGTNTSEYGNLIRQVSGGSGDVDPSNVVTLDSEQIISGKKVFENLALVSTAEGIAWSEDLITNQVDLSGMTLVFNKNITQFSVNMPYFVTSNGYMLVGTLSQLDILDPNGMSIACLYFGGWKGDSFTLPNDFGFIATLIVDNAVGLLNEIFPTILISGQRLSASIIFDEDKYISMPQTSGTIATQEWVNAQDFGGGAINPENLKKLNVQHAVIADLEPGAYLWEYDDVKTLDYYSGTKEIYQNPTFLQITVTGDGGQKDFYLFDDGYGADESRQELIWGAIYINSETGTPDEGFCNSRFLYDIPSREQEFNVDTNGQPISLCGSSVGLYAPQSDSCIEFYVGESDETSITMSPGGIDVAAHNGNLNLYADSSIYLTAESGDIVFENSSFFKTTATFESDVNFDGDATFNNGLTLNGALYLANNGEINDAEDRLSIYKGTGSMWIGTEEGGYIEITDDNLFVESFSNLNLVSDSDITLSSQNGSTYFSGNVDFTNANVTGLNVSGGGKTKITVAQLKSLMANYTANIGKLIQFVYKGSVFSERTITQAIGTVTIANLNSISKTVGISSATSSALMGTNYGIYISSTEAYISIDSWDFDIANGITNVNTGSKTNITDANFDIYVIGE